MSPEERYANMVKINRVQVWLGIVMLAACLFLFVMNVLEKASPQRRISLLLSGFVVAVVILFTLIRFWQYTQASVPFGF